MQEVQLRRAKATLSALVDDAKRGEPSIITRHGRPEAVVVGYEEWERLAHVPSFGRLLMSAPLDDATATPRSPAGLRDLER
jgi:antitoxin Phd